MSLSEEHLKIIAANPLNDALQGVRSMLHLATDPSREVIIALVGVLLNLNAADILPAPDETHSAAKQLLDIRRKLREGGLKLELFSPLVNAVVTNSPDRSIWEAVINIINVVNPSIPSSTLVPTTFATPIKASSARLGDSETRDIVELELFFEIKDCTHRYIPGFFEKHFNTKIWNKGQNDMLERLMRHHNGKRWTGFPADPWERPVWEWLTSLEHDSMANALYKFHTTRKATEFKERKGQMDIFFQKLKHKNRNNGYYFMDVLVVGEHKRSHNTSDFKACLLQLTRYVRDVFADQPLRRFVHAFTLRATTMELWIFDRSGPYSSGEFDIHEEPRKLACALVAYATMNDDSMGLDTFTELKNNRRYVVAKDAQGKENQVELAKNKLLVRQRAVVCRGTTCFGTKSGVAKFSWPSAARQPSEVKYLRLAEARGVEGVAKAIAHSEITSIADLRNGLDFSEHTRHKFRLGASEQSSSLAKVKTSDNSGSSRKRKSSSEDYVGRLTRSRFNSQKSALRLVCDGSSDGSNDGSRNGSKDETRPRLSKPDREAPYENRILSCLIISPTGRAVSEFQSIRELLEVLRDAIRAHQSLYIKGQILHRDISPNNIIITDTKEPGDFKGMLIDLDLAKERESGPNGARHQTGTMQFMAMEVLRGKDHTYRHDLESFFYVLLWMCARVSWTKYQLSRGRTPPKVSLLRKWEVGSFKEIARTKLADMTTNGLDEVSEEFPPAFDIIKALCGKVRTLLFGDTSGTLAIGTPAGDPNQLYNAIITTYDETLRQI